MDKKRGSYVVLYSDFCGKTGQSGDGGRKIDVAGRSQHRGQVVTPLGKEGKRSDFAFLKFLTPFEK